MLEEANRIFDYLPIRFNSPVERDYIYNLWKTVEVLGDGDEDAQPFVMMPFH